MKSFLYELSIAMILFMITISYGVAKGEIDLNDTYSKENIFKISINKSMDLMIYGNETKKSIVQGNVSLINLKNNSYLCIGKCEQEKRKFNINSTITTTTMPKMNITNSTTTTLIKKGEIS